MIDQVLHDLGIGVVITFFYFCLLSLCVLFHSKKSNLKFFDELPAILHSEYGVGIFVFSGLTCLYGVSLIVSKIIFGIIYLVSLVYIFKNYS